MSTAPTSRDAILATSASSDAPLSKTPGDPRHQRIGQHRRLGRVWVGGLGVVDVGDPVGHRDDLATMPARLKRRDGVHDRGGGHLDAAGQRPHRPGCRARRPDPAPGWTRPATRPGRRQTRGRPAARRAHRAKPRSGSPRRKPARTGADRGAQQCGRPAVIQPDHRHPAIENPGLRGGVLVHRRMPIQVILGDVEHRPRLRAQRRCPEQLKAGQLDGQQVGGLVSGVENRVRRCCRTASCADPPADQHCLQQRRRRGLAVGAGHNKTWSIDKNVGAIAEYFHKIVTNPTVSSLHERAAGLVERFGGKTVAHVARKAEEAAKGLIGPGMLFEEFGLNYFGPIDGHNLPLLIETFKFLKKQNRPVVLHAITQKGRGFQPAIEKQKKFHGLGPYDAETGETKPAGQKTYSEIFAESLTKLATGMTRWSRLRRRCRMGRRWIFSGRIIRSATSMWGLRRSMR